MSASLGRTLRISFLPSGGDKMLRAESFVEDRKSTVTVSQRGRRGQRMADPSGEPEFAFLSYSLFHCYEEKS